MNSKIAFIFPGQGSQSIGMLSELADRFPHILDTYQEASEYLGYDLWQLVQQGPESQLNQTEFTQPALLAASVALWRLWQAQSGKSPAILAGHSLGEYSALVCAQSLDYESALRLVAMRGRLMQEAAGEGRGAMAAIVGLADEVVSEICEQAAEGQVLTPANFNAIGQIVLAGETLAVERAIALAKQAGAKIAKLIPVSVPSHCALMKPAADRLKKYLQQINIASPQIPVLTNVDVFCYDDPDQIRSALVRQLYNPVRWVETIQYLAKSGVGYCIECGPGKVLTGLNKRIDPSLITLNIDASDSLQKAVTVHP